jgi:hypothetical protein
MDDYSVLRGANVLVLEDDYLTNLDTTVDLEALGCRIHSCLHLDEAW